MSCAMQGVHPEAGLDPDCAAAGGVCRAAVLGKCEGSEGRCIVGPQEPPAPHLDRGKVQELAPGNVIAAHAPHAVSAEHVLGDGCPHVAHLLQANLLDAFRRRVGEPRQDLIAVISEDVFWPDTPPHDFVAVFVHYFESAEEVQLCAAADGGIRV